MDIWFGFAIMSMLAIGFVSFINKIFVERKYDLETVTLTFYFNFFLITLFFFLLFGDFNFSLIIILSALLIAFTDTMLFRVRLKALKYISSSNYFINLRVISSIGLLIIGAIFFNDDISLYEYIGFFLGFVIFYFLAKDDLKTQKNSKQGLIYLFLAIIFILIGHSISKHISTIGNIFSFLFLLSCFALIFSTTIFFKNKKGKLKSKNLKSIMILNGIQGILFFTYFYLILRTYALGDLAISYKIQSYSPFIPVILSILIYNEKVTLNKSIAFVLAIISLWLFAI